MNKENKKYDHAYAVIRVDDGINFLYAEAKIMVKLILFEEQDAKNEVERLNLVNADKGCRYYYQITRIHRGAPSTPLSHDQPPAS